MFGMSYCFLLNGNLAGLMPKKSPASGKLDLFDFH